MRGNFEFGCVFFMTKNIDINSEKGHQTVGIRTIDTRDFCHPTVLPIPDFLHPIFLEHGRLTPSDYDYDNRDS